MDYTKIIEKQREYFHQNHTHSLQFRIEQLKKLKNAIQKNEEKIIEALNLDLSKSKFEAFISEIGILYDEINFAIRYLPKWIKSKKVKTPFVHFKAESYIVNEPYGVVLIISPWNYPFQLAISPLIGAIAAGNTAVIKPSEYSVHTSNIIEQLFKETFDESFITVIQGGKEETDSLLNHAFDYIFFTGSVGVGKIIMEKASKHLTPVTLELGGKSPCIVNEDADISLAAKKIVFGKLFNTGQTCVAPDYILAHHSIKQELVKEIEYYIELFYGEDILKNKDYPKIISERHFRRLVEMIENKEVLYGGQYDEKNHKIEPTLIGNLSEDDVLMREEIFGPILPIVEYKHMDEAIHMVKSKPKPLALYLFTRNKNIEQKVINTLSFGGGCINDTIMHLATSYLPFGGVGESGMGSYHGQASFETFTHSKSILKKSKFLDINMKYPPYDDKKYRMIKRLFK